MEIQARLQIPATSHAVQQYNQDTSVNKAETAPSGVVVDIQSRQEPLGVALASALQSLVENAGLSEAAATAASSPAYATGPESVAARLSSVAAHMVASKDAEPDQDADNLTQMFNTIRQSIDQGFDEAQRIASDPANQPLQQARDLTRQQMDSLENMLGLRDNRAA